MLLEEEASADLYEVEKVCDVRQHHKGLQVLIKWSGYDDPADNTWEPYTNLNEETCLYFLREYRQNLMANTTGKTLEHKMQVLDRIIRLWKSKMKKAGKHFNDSGELLKLISEKEDNEESSKTAHPARLVLEAPLDDSDFRIKKKQKPLDPKLDVLPPSERIPDPTNTGEFLFGMNFYKKEKKRLKAKQQAEHPHASTTSEALIKNPAYEKAVPKHPPEKQPLGAASKTSISCNRHLLKIVNTLESSSFCQSVDNIASEWRIDSCEQLAKKTRLQDCLYLFTDTSSSTGDLRCQIFSSSLYLHMNTHDAISRQVQAISEKIKHLSDYHKLYSRLV